MTPERDQQIMDVFLTAVELANERRTAYLDDACGPDEALRAEVESLLRYNAPDTLISHDGPGTSDRPNAKSRTRSKIRPTYGRHSALKKLHRRRFTVVSIVLLFCLALLWYVVHQSISEKLRQNVRSQLQTVVNADVSAIEIWLAKQVQTAESWANNSRLKKLLAELARISAEQGLTTSELEQTREHAQFLETISPLLAQPEVSFVGVFARDGHGIAKCPEPAVSDVSWSPRGAQLISRCFDGETVFIPTFRVGANVVGAPKGFLTPAVSFVTPIRDEGGRIIAAMQLIMRIDEQFAELFSVARLGETGETYAFDERGVVLTNLRHEEQVRHVGLIPKEGRAAINLQLRDPGVELTGAARAHDALMARPITRVPALAIAGKDAIDVVGYRNYLGVKVVGASQWLGDYGFGVVAEMAYEEAYAPLESLTWMFRGVFGLFALVAAVAAFCWLKNRWLREQVAEARKLGQYTLGELLGQGGMGKVYQATHVMLQRPSAIKLIEPHDADAETIARFEREVQLASELTHPNTVQIYDYGCTDDGVFYYVMEYLPGVTLNELVARDGPLPAARVVHLLRQVCASLDEAHGRNLVHRDVKPGNIMVCERGGQYDFVKVLDFGLAQRTAAVNHTGPTHSQTLSGTPLYIAPERIRRPSTLDPRSDVYSVGTVAFFLLTGDYLFDGESTMDILYKVVNEEPRRPSEAATEDIPARLDELVLDCIAKDADERPADIGILLEILDSIAADWPWRQTDARKWWRPHEPPAIGDRPDASQGGSVLKV